MRWIISMDLSVRIVMVMVGLPHQENVMSAKERSVLFVKAVED